MTMRLVLSKCKQNKPNFFWIFCYHSLSPSRLSPKESCARSHLIAASLERMRSASARVPSENGNYSLEVIRWEYRVENFFGMVCPRCVQILPRYL